MGEEIPVAFKPSVLALDGEREVTVNRDMEVSVRLSDRGPRVVDIARALHEASTTSFLVNSESDGHPGATCLILENRICLAPCPACLPLQDQVREGGQRLE